VLHATRHGGGAQELAGPDAPQSGRPSISTATTGMAPSHEGRYPTGLPKFALVTINEMSGPELRVTCARGNTKKCDALLPSRDRLGP
jgi:hypothetical protein